MIGRGSYGRPWVVGALSRVLQGLDEGFAPSGADLADVVIEQYEGTLACYGVEIGVKCMRKHLSWYLAGRPGGLELRARVIRSVEAADIIRELSDYEWPEVAVEQVAA